MLAIVGTVPEPNFPIISGSITLEDKEIIIRGMNAPVNRGTPALMAAAVKTCETLGQTAPYGYLVGDTGRGEGSRSLYEYLTRLLGKADLHSGQPGNFRVIAFHYLQPDVDWHNRVLLALDKMPRRPLLIADAGFMYAAKMSGQAAQYDLFTPDVGELAFLADEEAPHPFYTRGFILHEENRTPEMIARAYRHNNASRWLLVKGQQDYVADRHGILATVDSPAEESMEAIGGTGDTLTGIVAALAAGCIEIREAAVIAARANRLAGHYSRPTPATQVIDIIRHIPDAIKDVL